MGEWLGNAYYSLFCPLALSYSSLRPTFCSQQGLYITNSLLLPCPHIPERGLDVSVADICLNFVCLHSRFSQFSDHWMPKIMWRDCEFQSLCKQTWKLLLESLLAYRVKPLVMRYLLVILLNKFVGGWSYESYPPDLMPLCLARNPFNSSSTTLNRLERVIAKA